MPTLTPVDRALLETPLPPLRRLALPGGEVVEYRRTGRAGPPVVLVHGIGASSAGYRAQLAGLAGAFRVVAWNAPGYGGSTPLPQAAPDVLHYAERLQALIEALALGPVHLVGSSWGTLIAGAHAATFPRQVTSLVLAVPPRGYGMLDPAERARRLAIRLDPALRPEALEAQVARYLGPDPDPLVVRRFGAQRAAIRAAGLAQATRMLFACDALERAATITTRTLVLAGDADRVTPAAAHAWPLRDALPHARGASFAGCGHLLQLEAPDRFNRTIAEFFLQARRDATEGIRS